jgi:hypothetical protein
LEKEIQHNEITQDAQASRTIADRVWCQVSPDLDQTALRVASLKIPIMNSVEIVVLYSFLASDTFDEWAFSDTLGLKELLFAKKRKVFLRSLNQNADHWPKSFPKNRVPMYSNCHSGQGGIRIAILLCVL